VRFISFALFDQNGKQLTGSTISDTFPIVNGEFDFYFEVGSDCDYELSPGTTYKYQITVGIITSSRVTTSYKSEKYEFTTKK